MRRIRVLVCALLFLLAAACGSAEAAQTPQNTPTTAAATTTLAPTESIPTEAPTPSGPLGSISGKIMPPNPDPMPPQPTTRIYAHEVNTGRVTSVEIPHDQLEYSIKGLPVGVYEVIGWFYPQSTTGAYTSANINPAVTSSSQLKCNTSLKRVVLKTGSMDVQNIDLGCWGGDFFYLITPTP
jgi:hypothetical protein